MAVLPECSSYLAQVAESPHTRTRDDVGTVCSHPAAIPVSATSDHPYLGGSDEYALRNPLREICTAGSVRGEIPEQARVDLNGHEAGNGGYSQRKPTAHRSPLLGERSSCCCCLLPALLPAWRHSLRLM